LDTDVSQFFDIYHRPEDILSPIYSIVICTTVQAFLVYRCTLFAGTSKPPLARDTVQYKVKKWVVTAILAVGVALSFAGGLGSAIALEFSG